MPTTFEQFLVRIAQSGLMDEEDLRAFRERLPAEKRADSIEALSRELIIQNHLTPYQVERLVEGSIEGLVLGNYVVLEKVGEGGMGEVFRAQHRRMKRIVAVKLLPHEATESISNVRRFQREVEAAAKLVHPNIVTAFDADESNGIYFLVMEFVDGESLVNIVSQGGPLSLKRAIDYTLQMARGLDYAHRLGVIHRDIKPSNILVDQWGTVKILDMGLARLTEDHVGGVLSEESMHLTQSGEIMGTFDYMSPEQAEDARDVDHRCDIYSLGCTMYSLLTADVPYPGDTMMKKLLAHREKPIPKVSAIRPDVPDDLEQVFATMVAKRSADRYATMGEVVAALDDVFTRLDVEFDAAPVVRGRGRHLPLDPTVTLDPTIVEQRATTPAPLTEILQSERDTRSETDTWASDLGTFAVGIDLGTTYSAVAYLDNHGRPRTIVNAEGETTTPSVMLFDCEEVLVGKEAVRAMATDMELIAECPKRDVGERMFHKALNNQQYPPEALEAWILNKLRLDAQRAIGDFQKVVITVPAYFDEVRRKATQDAGYMAGFEVLDIINEPTAAALSYGFHEGYLSGGGGDRKKILVYDLGGGTFDVSIMEIGGNTFVALASDGDVRLGGRDFDQRLVDLVADKFREQHDVDPREEANTLGRLWRNCEEAKRALSIRQRTSVLCEHNGKASRVAVTRKMFEELTADLLDRTRFTTSETLRAAGLEWSDIDRVLLVGGSTRMPAVSELLEELSGKTPDRSVSPDEAVAHGAALHAGLLLSRSEGRMPRFHVTNVSSHSLGVVASDKRTKLRKNVTLIPRNTPLPATAKKSFRTQSEGQKMILVEIVEGESKRADDCSPVGNCEIHDLPPDLPEKTPIEVAFHYAENGRLRVSVRVRGSKREVEQELVRPNGLNQDHLDRWRHHISGQGPIESPSRQVDQLSPENSTDDAVR
ncbi:MAG: Hsp70 family protein [Pirellulaceae bacterium]